MPPLALNQVGSIERGWKDILGIMVPDPDGTNHPSLQTYSGAIREWFYNVADMADCRFHLPHDYAPGTDVFAHMHWSHIGTAISGSLVVRLSAIYSKGHNQAIYGSQVQTTITVPTPDLATVPRYRHRIDEVQLSSAIPSGALLDSALLEPDGLILLNAEVLTIPTITGGGSGAQNRPAIHFIDLHYQSDRVNTPQKAPDFYTP